MPKKLKFFAILCVILVVLASCMMPTNSRDFMEDEKIYEIINRVKAGLIVGVNPPKIENIPPELIWEYGATEAEIAEGGTVTLSRTGTDYPDSITIKVINYDDYDAFEWYFDGILLETGHIFAVDTADPQFNVPGTYSVTLAGTNKNDVSYETSFFMKVEL